MELTQQEVLKFLDSLGPSASAVALSLKGLGVKGDCGDSQNCPVANALKERFDTYFSVFDEISSFETGVFTTPAPVFEFIRRFDHGEFEELEEVGR